jgi:hypothetical protein
VRQLRKRRRRVYRRGAEHQRYEEKEREEAGRERGLKD